MAYAVVRTDNMSATKDNALIKSAKYFVSTTETKMKDSKSNAPTIRRTIFKIF